MKKDISGMIVGLLFIAVAVVVGGSMLGLIDLTFNLSGWWTVFIIVPALISIVQGGFNAGSLVILSIGVILLLNAQEVLPYGISWKIIFPILLFGIGFQLLFAGNKSKPWKTKKFTETSSNATGSTTYKTASVFFGGQELSYGMEEFTGANYSAVFGGLTIDMRNVTVVGDVIIQVSALFGGIEIILPDNVQVIVNVAPVLGGTECKYRQTNDPLVPKIIINGTATLGGIEIK